MRRRIPIVAISLGFALLTLAPYLWAEYASGAHRFTGFLMNPFDAASYLAKMRLGWEGAWTYRLIFSAMQGGEAYLFEFYLLLGHFARLLGAPLTVVYHLARVVGAVVFLVTAWEFLERYGLSPRVRAVAWGVLFAGSGFGWAAVLFGGVTADLWVAEFIPFSAMLVSAHFPLAMALQMGLVMAIALPARPVSFLRSIWIAVMACLLGMIQPFGILVPAAALAAWILWRRLAQGRFPEGSLWGLAALAVGAVPWLAYDAWVVASLPAFASWSAQNQTPSPPPWDLALSTGVAGLICVALFVRWIIRRAPIVHRLMSLDEPRVILALWLTINLLAVYAPFALQRRLLLGMMIPIAALAAPFLARFIFPAGFSARRLLIVCLILPLSNVVILGAMLRAVQAKDAAFFLDADTSAAVDWLASNAPAWDAVLAPVEVARWIPGMAGLRVAYGHPMETPNAETVRQDLEAFYAPGAEPRRELLLRLGARWWLSPVSDGDCSLAPGGETAAVFESMQVCLLRSG